MKNKSLIVASLLTAVSGATLLGATPAEATPVNKWWCQYPLSKVLLQDQCNLPAGAIPNSQGSGQTNGTGYTS
jgi:hypothetical protein